MAKSGIPFTLTKWYLDVLAENGLGLIGYNASLRWGKLSFGYEGVIPIGNCKFKQSGRLTGGHQPEESGKALHWKPADGEGQWEAHVEPVKCVLLKTEAGLIDWHCLQPCSRVDMTFANQRIRGWGYAERIEITIPPWQLPLKELYWGRYVSESYAIVWIRWVGPEQRLLIFCNGCLESGVVDEEAIQFRNIDLRLPKKTIRKGNIGKSVFSGLKKIAALLPGSVLSLHEEKWAGKAELLRGGLPVDRGNVIHEKVIWP